MDDAAGEFELFFSEQFRRVRRSLALIIGDLDGAEEATEEAFARAFVRWRRVRDMERPVSWILVVALNVARTRHTRDHRARTRLVEAKRAVVDDPWGRVACAVDLRNAVSLLPERQRTCIVLRYFTDLSVADIAMAMRCPEGTVKSTIHAGLQNLRIDLTPDEE